MQRFFRDRLEAWGRDGPAMKESTLNRVDLLTLSPLLRAGLGSPDNAVDFRHVLDSGTSLLINLAIPYPDTRRLFGCLLTVSMESAALSRSDVTAKARQTTHHLLIDEFSQFMAQSEESLTRMLSETRKYQLFCVMAHQNWSQASDRLKGALQNVGLEVIFKAGRVDAEYSARLISQVDPRAVKHTVTDEDAAERTHPAYFPLLEQWETYTQQIQTLRTGQAFLRLPDDTVKRVTTPRLPVVSVPAAQLTEVQESTTCAATSGRCQRLKRRRTAVSRLPLPAPGSRHPCRSAPVNAAGGMAPGLLLARTGRGQPVSLTNPLVRPTRSTPGRRAGGHAAANGSRAGGAPYRLVQGGPPRRRRSHPVQPAKPQ